MPAINIQVSSVNMPARRIDWEDAVKGLGLPKTLTSAQTKVSNNMQIMTPKAVKTRLLLALTSGAATFTLCRHAGTPNFTPGADAIALDVADTAHRFIELDTTVAKPWISVQIVDDGAGTVIAQAAVYTYDVFPTGSGYHELISGFSSLPVDGGANLPAFQDTLA